MMSCACCCEKAGTDLFHDTVDDQGRLRLGAWRWASWCQDCGDLVDYRGTDAQALAPITSSTLAAPPDTAAPAEQSYDGQPTEPVHDHGNTG